MLDSTGPRDIRHVHQSVNAVFDLDEGAEVSQVSDAAMNACTNW